jgi:3-methyladenine DNA glycosylase AlkD
VSPARLAAQANKALRARAHHPPRRATRFFKPWERVYTLGMSSREIRELARELAGPVRKSWKIEDAVAFAELMLRGRTFESRSVGLIVLSKFHRGYDARLLRHARRWLATNKLDNWAMTDLLCMEVLGPLLDREPQLALRMRPWTRAKSPWLRRAAAAALTGPVRHGVALDEAYRTASTLAAAKEDLVHKATGWMLREAGRSDQPRLEKWLKKKGRTLHRTALRYAIEKFPEPKRRHLLLVTSQRDEK